MRDDSFSRSVDRFLKKLCNNSIYSYAVENISLRSSVENAIPAANDSISRPRSRGTVFHLFKRPFINAMEIGADFLEIDSTYSRAVLSEASNIDPYLQEIMYFFHSPGIKVFTLPGTFDLSGWIKCPADT